MTHRIATPLSLAPLREGRPADEGLAARRGGITVPTDYPAFDQVRRDEIVLGDLPCLRLSAESGRGTLFHIHGGGFRLGGPPRMEPFARALAARANCTVIVPAYPLAPEHPFPAALHGLFGAYHALEAAGPLVLGGDSAGGNLATALYLLGASADALLLMSPWLDLRVASEGYDRSAATDQLFSRAAAEGARDGYLQGHSADDPLASPLLSDAGPFPPTLVVAGGGEVLLDDSLAFAARLAKCCTDVDLHVVAEMQHVAPTFSSQWPGSAAAMDVTVAFLRRQFGAAGDGA